LLLLLPGVALSQAAPMVIAWQAPPCTPSNSYCSSDADFNTFVTYILPNVSGIGTVVPWSSIDSGCTDGTYPSECTTQPTTCPESFPSTDYKFCHLDKGLNAYVTNTAFSDKKIVLIIWAVSDSSPNTSTPQYVFSSQWAGSPKVSSAPQDMAVCNSWQGDISQSNPGTCPVSLKPSDSWASGDYAVWNANETGASGCSVFPSSGSGDLQCATSPCSTLDTSGFPVVYEKPFMIAYKDFLANLAQHYNPKSASSYGSGIAPYIAYVRAGMAEGGENQPFCATQGSIPQLTRGNHQSVQAGYVVNTSSMAGGASYVATGAGTTDNAAPMPTCSPAGCTTASDGTMPGWYNAGSYGTAGSNAIWPGPKGIDPITGEPQGYTDNGYLTTWPPPPPPVGDGTGYITSMVTFLKSLGASFPFDISAHVGPPFNETLAYADSEAIVASANGVGFGLQAGSIGDSSAFAKGFFPSSSTDWAHNFKTYPAPVHHIQTYEPGDNSFAAGYAITSPTTSPSGPGITISGGTATVSCVTDCSWFSGLANLYIYVAGNSNPALNGIWLVSCPAQCAANTLQFQTAVTAAGTGGAVWAPDYWPILMPFAVLQGVTSIEAYECDLDYAFGVQTTTWLTYPPSPGSIGCALWGISGGPDAGYKNALKDTLGGQPVATSVRAGQSILVKGSQF